MTSTNPLLAAALAAVAGVPMGSTEPQAEDSKSATPRKPMMRIEPPLRERNLIVVDLHSHCVFSPVSLERKLSTVRENDTLFIYQLDDDGEGTDTDEEEEEGEKGEEGEGGGEEEEEENENDAAGEGEGDEGDAITFGTDANADERPKWTNVRVKGVEWRDQAHDQASNSPRRAVLPAVLRAGDAGDGDDRGDEGAGHDDAAMMMGPSAAGHEEGHHDEDQASDANDDDHADRRLARSAPAASRDALHVVPLHPLQPSTAVPIINDDAELTASSSAPTDAMPLMPLGCHELECHELEHELECHELAPEKHDRDAFDASLTSHVPDARKGLRLNSKGAPTNTPPGLSYPLTRAANPPHPPHPLPPPPPPPMPTPTPMPMPMPMRARGGGDGTDRTDRTERTHRSASGHTVAAEGLYASPASPASLGSPPAPASFPDGSERPYPRKSAPARLRQQGQSDITLTSLWHHSDITMVSGWRQSGVSLVSVWRQSGVSLASVWRC